MRITKNTNIELLPSKANRHGLIAGATGTGKTTTLRVITEEFSRLGVPVFLADVKGDLSGIAKPYPTTFWDVFGQTGHPIRTTVKDLGPLVLARLLDLNRIQTGVLTLAYKVQNDYLSHDVFLNLNCVKALLKHLADNAYDYTTDYGNITYTSVGAIQRAILELETQRVNEFLNLPKFEIEDFFVYPGMIHVLDAKILINYPKLYTTFLIWLLSELYEKLPEIGDPEKPVFIFFFDEAHLLFNDISKILLQKIEQVIRLIRSKGVGVYFCSQSPLDIPKTILGQLGNRMQHAIRAFTPDDYNAVKKISRTFRHNPRINIMDALTTMGTGEALVSFLEQDGKPSMVEKVFIKAPESQISPLTNVERDLYIKQSPYYGKYDKAVYELEETMIQPNDNRANQFIEKFGREIVRTAGNQVAREIIRGVFHTFFKGVRSGVGR